MQALNQKIPFLRNADTSDFGGKSMSHHSWQEKMEAAGTLLYPGLSLRWYPCLDSTNTLALNEPDLPQGAIIAADAQAAGRGRLGRVWQSPPGLNLYFSLVLYPNLSQEHWGGFSLAAGVGLAEGLAELGLAPQLKWPNDVLWQGAKLAGILLEAGKGRLVVGVGVNVNQEIFPPELRATSLRLATGRIWARDQLLAIFSREIWRWCQAWQRGLFEQVIAAWRQRDSILGLEVTVLRGEETIRRVAVDVLVSGALVVEDAKALRHVLHSGEVTIGKGQG
jgi:BirA family biotin operon repressor/biotin-[acetyl-CoA-carboxylase] ligase